jgi:AmmeMemoRadiSam system protein B
MIAGNRIGCQSRHAMGGAAMDDRTIDPSTIRPSPIAGTWYPGSRRELYQIVDHYLEQAEFVPTDDELVALISPHAGYPYSGPTAAHAYRQLSGKTYDLVVLLGPSHYQDFGPCAISAKRYYSTPLGLIELDRDFIRKLAQKIRVAFVEQDNEHSLEIQLPFLQRVLGVFKLVPIMMSLPFYLIGPEAFGPCEELATALAELAGGQRVLFVASSDLSHLSDYEAVKKFDARTAALVAALDIPELVHYMWQDHECRACGDAPIVTALLAAQELGAQHARVLHRTNSGDVTGSHSHGQYTVGYMAAGVYR